MLINEVKRAIKSKKFLVIILMGLAIHLLSGFKEIKPYIFFNYNAPDLNTPEAQATARAMVTKALNKYDVWFSTMYFYIFAMPILSAFPFSLSHLEDKEFGMIKCIDARVNHKKYLKTKVLVNGIAGGLAVALPTVISSIIVSIFFKGSINDFSGKGIDGGIFAQLVIDNFPLYIMVHIFINFMFGFAYAQIALAVSSFIKNKIAITLSPFLFWIGVSTIFSALNINHFSPMLINQFHVVPEISLGEIIIELIAITAIFAVLFMFKARKRNIYE